MVIRFILFIFSYRPPPSNVTASGLQALIANESALLGIQDTSEPPRSYINARRQHSSLHCGSSGPGHILSLFLLACSKQRKKSVDEGRPLVVWALISSNLTWSPDIASRVSFHVALGVWCIAPVRGRRDFLSYFSVYGCGGAKGAPCSID